MNLRAFLEWAETKAELLMVDRPVHPILEVARVIRVAEPRPILFNKITDSEYRLVANVCARREHFAWALGVEVTGILPRLVAALAAPITPPVIEQAPCQEIVEPAVDLTAIPILTHMPQDGGPYITAGIVVIHDPDYGRNVCFHRLRRLDERRLVARIVEGRGTDTAWRKRRDLEVAICLGNPLHVLLAAAMSPPKGVDELAIANALAPTPTVRCRTKNLYVPAESEIILEGHLTQELASEGPFLDLTETWDLVRQQPVIEIDCVTHRREPIYHALLPGRLEHKLLMGMPREPTIFAAVSQACDCQDVFITPGGMSWLHAVVQIRKHKPDDGRQAIAAAFEGHPSLKHVVVVDEDIDIQNPAEVEWAIATRVQADKDVVILSDQPSSSLDPSALHVPGQKSRTSKMGVDATIPWQTWDGRLRSHEERAAFHRVSYEPVDLLAYITPGRGERRT